MSIKEIFDHIWFTSDQHFGHENIIQYAERPYNSALEMDEDLIEKWNNKIDQWDTVYHLGDFALGNTSDANSYFNRLNGIIHILNNYWHHDKRWIHEYDRCGTRGGFAIHIEPPIDVLEISELGENNYPLAITLCHYPIGEWDRKHYGAWHLHGHSHNKYHGEGKILDVGVDCAIEWLGEYRPFSLSEVIEIMDSK